MLSVVVTALAGCSRGPTEPDGAGLTDAEISWVADYAAWGADLDELLRREEVARAGVLSGGAASEAYGEVAVELAGCSRSLDDALGSTPTVRLEPIARALDDICRAVVPAVERLATAPAPRRTTLLVVTLHAVEQAALRRDEIGDEVDELLLARGPLPELGGTTERSRVEPTLTAAAAAVADGRSVHVRCWSAADWRKVLREEDALTNGQLAIDTTGAFAVPLTSTLHLQQEQCGPLARLAYDGWEPTGGDLSELAYAVGVLSHEIQHIAGRGTEAETECAGLQHLAGLARELGASESYSLLLARTYLEEHYPPDADEYASPECRPGGALDLAPETSAWPTG